MQRDNASSPLSRVGHEVTFAVDTATQAYDDLVAHNRDLSLALDRARTEAVARERSIAILGHDLRNSIQAISFGAEQLKSHDHSPTLGVVASRIERSCSRMSGLVNSVLDFTRGRNGEGMALVRGRSSGLEVELRHVVAEIQASHPERLIHTVVALPLDVDCDHGRIAQLLANLLKNAVIHGDATRAVTVCIATDETMFRIAVGNGGSAIPESRIAHMFDAFAHGDIVGRTEGLGLGLYIAAEIARAHSGNIEVTSTDEVTRFTFSMPQA